MRSIVSSALLISLVIGSMAESVAAQDLHPSRRASPMGTARITLDDTYIRIVYGRPYQRGRENIFGTADSGALVPWGEVWRTGANEATEMSTTGDLDIAGRVLPAGTYSIFTVPGPERWSIHFNSALGLSGTGRFDAATGQFEQLDIPATDVLVVEAEVVSLEEEVDQFTIALDAADSGATLCLRWITTAVCVPIGNAP